MPLVATALRATQYSVWLKRRMSLNEVLSVCVSGDQGGCSQIPKSSQGIDSFEKAVRSVRSDVIVYKKKEIKKDGAGKCGGLRFSIGLLGTPAIWRAFSVSWVAYCPKGNIY